MAITHQVTEPGYGELELTVDVTLLSDPRYGTCDNCGADAVANGDEGCGPFAGTAAC
jgi:hypothetical protein